MRKLRNTSIALLFAATAGVMLSCFVIPAPDWLIRIFGILLLVSIFTASYSTAKIHRDQR